MTLILEPKEMDTMPDTDLAKFKKVAVIGSGVMGRGIAAFYADRGLPVQLYDLDKSIVEKAIAALVDPKAKIPLIMTARNAKRITPLGLESLADYLGEVDLIVEAVPEVIKIKLGTFEKIDKYRKQGSIVASNTSGLSITSMADGRSDDFRTHFLGVHFFNPVRFMDLVELIPAAETDPQVLEAMRSSLELAGKTPVIGKDTPNFIANRIGVFAMMKTLQLMPKYNMTPEEVDMVTGPPTGAPKTGTFRLADMVGIDTLVHVAQNPFENCPDDEERAVFDVPAFVKAMVEKGMHGDKTGGGFYKKSQTAEGKREILTLDLETLDYRTRKDARSAAVRVAKTYSAPADRVRALLTYDDDDRICRFAREMVAASGAYALNRVGEICDDPQTIDIAMRAGFGRDLGPIETLELIGLERAARYMEQFHIPIPKLLAAAIANGTPLLKPAPPSPKVICSKSLRAAGKTVRENLSARLVDMGEGVLLCELDAKMVPTMNPIDDHVISMMFQAHEEIHGGNFRALVIGNQAKSFCAGAQLLMVLEMAKAKRWDVIGQVVKGLQTANLMNLQAGFPVVVAPHGMTLGGGLEISLGGQVRVAFAELYCGLVEVGVGLIPAGAGCYLLLRNWVQRMAKKQPGPMPPVAKAFELIGFGAVSKSAFDAIDKGLLRKDDVVVFNRREHLTEAKKVALARLANFRQQVAEALPLPGEAGYLALSENIDGMQRAGKISEHSAVIAKVQANILTGGLGADFTKPTTAERVLELEMEGFLKLCGMKATQERMSYMLKNKKPLIN